MIQRQRFLFLFLLRLANCFQILTQTVDLNFQLLNLRRSAFHLPVAACPQSGYFAKFALQTQRSTACFATAANGVAVIADAIGQQEIQIRILKSQALR